MKYRKHALLATVLCALSASPAMASSIYHREVEPNNYWSSADFVSPSLWRVGTVSSLSDYDWFARDASTTLIVRNKSGGTLRVYFPDTDRTFYLHRGGWANAWGGCPYRRHYVRIDSITSGRINYTVETQ